MSDTSSRPPIRASVLGDRGVFIWQKALHVAGADLPEPVRYSLVVLGLYMNPNGTSGRPGYDRFALALRFPPFDTLIKTALTAHPEPSEALWQAVLHAMPHWRPRSHDHLAPVVLLAHPALAALITPERGRELLSVPRLTDPPETPRDRPRHRPMP